MARQNRILAGIPAVYGPLLDSGLSLQEMSRGDTLDLSGPSQYAFFPITAVLSYATRLPDGHSVQLALLGHEHCIGVERCFLSASDADSSEVGSCSVFIPGAVLSVTRDSLVALKRAFPNFLLTALKMARYYEFLFAHQAVCAASHPVGDRVASWLMYAVELCRRQELDVSQQQLADFLAVRRETVGMVLTDLERHDIISRSRSVVAILSPERLAARSCGCARLLIDGHRRMQVQ